MVKPELPRSSSGMDQPKPLEPRDSLSTVDFLNDLVSRPRVLTSHDGLDEGMLGVQEPSGIGIPFVPVLKDLPLYSYPVQGTTFTTRTLGPRLGFLPHLVGHHVPGIPVHSVLVGPGQFLRGVHLVQVRLEGML